jgi:glycosyltransferase involved in cell wall biosynthesis
MRATRKASWWLIGLQIIIVAAAGADDISKWISVSWPHIITGLQLALATLLWTSTRRSLREIQPPIAQPLSDRDLPTLSVAIPARNETDDLDACLQSLISSNYPKLEILVLDDCSQNKRTPGIIRDFAHSGVRFIAGEAPPTHWLAKNYAYHQLAAEANGEILLFCGVDTRFQPDTLRAMVEIMTQKRKSMVSFIPRNRLPKWSSIKSIFVQPPRYAWELSLPRHLVRRPPVLSTCWLIAAKSLKEVGGFYAVGRSIAPESYFARRLARTADSYSFLKSDPAIDFSSVKSLSEQQATAVRTRYPQLHRRLELVVLFGFTEAVALILPPVMLVANVLSGNWLLIIGSLVTIVLLVDFYARVVALTYRHFLWRGIWTLPLVAIYDIGLLNYSMWQYEFREVIWKGRNICLPVMQTISNSGKTP